MTDPRFRTLYPKIEDAPDPSNMADGFWIAVETVGDYMQDFVTVNGRYERRGPPYCPATAG